MQTLAILGASGHGKVVADAAIMAGWQHIVFFDDGWPHTVSLRNWSIVGTSENILDNRHHIDGVVVAIGNNEIRMSKTLILKNAGINLVTIVHPAATVSQTSKIGLGSVLFAGAVLNPDCSIGESCIINTHATVEHDCVLENGVHLSPNAVLGGDVSVGELSWIGIGASVRQQSRIGRQVIVGAGAVVVNDIPDCVTVAGVPAKIIGKREI